MMAVAANEGFGLSSIDIRAAFLQAKVLDREVLVVPPDDVRKPGIVWRLKKPLYGLDDASRKFWLKIREIFLTLGLKTIEGDEAFYYLNEGGKLKGAVLTHVDDFTIAGVPEFMEMVEKGIKESLSVSKVERDDFRFTGLDVIRRNDEIMISMDDYVSSLQEVLEIRRASG